MRFIASLMLVLLLATAACAGPAAAPAKQTPASTPSAAPSHAYVVPAPAPLTVPYTGPLFDTHLHLYVTYITSTLPLVEFEQVTGYLDRGKVDWAIGFYALPPNQSTLGSWSSEADKITKGVRRGIIPLLEPEPPQPFARGVYNEASLRQYFQPQGPLLGLGELLLKLPVLQSVTFDSPAMQTVFHAINDLKGILMIHLSSVANGGRATELAEIEPALRQYPDIVFLFHGGEVFDSVVAPLMSKYPNVYYTMDALNWMLNDPETRESLLAPKDDGSKNAESFSRSVNRIGFNRLLEDGLKRVAPRLQRYPDRVFWGSDLAFPWQFEDSVTDVVISISRQLIGQLPADLQEKYAYRNAQRVFGRFLTSKP